MTDRRTRLASREPMTVEEEAEDLLRRQRAGLIRQVDVGPCSSCGGYQQLVLATSEELMLLTSGSPIRADPVPCTACNGTGRRYRSGLELAAYCGHEAARLALGHVGPTAALRYAQTDGDYRAWWDGMASGWPRVAAAHGLHYTVSHYEEAKAYLIRWALTEP